jgi:polynucleotide 5'-kinase involved in rRNA processing
MPLVINMPGYIVNAGEVIMLDLIKILQPSHVMFLKDYNCNDKINQ